MVIRPYILAGGRSSRMGRDKAALSLGRRTLLARAVDTLRTVQTLKAGAGKVIVTIVGERTQLEGADRAIVDRYEGCGPLGGIEAALADLERLGDADWAFFIPVDMPFLSAELIDWLLRDWIAASVRGAWVCHAVVDGRPQPLVSLLHRKAHPFTVEALTAGRFKVTPVLQSAGEVLASEYADGIGCCLHTTEAVKVTLASFAADSIAAEKQEQLRRLWFSNINTEQEYHEAETIIAGLGSTG